MHIFVWNSLAHDFKCWKYQHIIIIMIEIDSIVAMILYSNHCERKFTQILNFIYIFETCKTIYVHFLFKYWKWVKVIQWMKFKFKYHRKGFSFNCDCWFILKTLQITHFRQNIYIRAHHLPKTIWQSINYPRDPLSILIDRQKLKVPSSLS